MLSPQNQLNALSWKSNQLGISYGNLVNQSSTRDLQVIYKEYEAVLAERKRREKSYMASFESKKKE